MPNNNPPKRHPLHQSRLYSIQSRAKLAGLFGLTRDGLDAVLTMDRPYSIRSKEIRRNGKTKVRIIQEPRGALRDIHIQARQDVVTDRAARIPVLPGEAAVLCVECCSAC